MTLPQLKKLLTENGIEFAANATLPVLTKLAKDNGLIEEPVQNPLQAQLEALLTKYPSQADFWVEPFDGAKLTLTEEVKKKNSEEKYSRCTIQNASGEVFYAGASSIAKAAKAAGLPADKCNFFRTFEKPGDLKTASYKAELAA